MGIFEVLTSGLHFVPPKAFYVAESNNPYSEYRRIEVQLPSVFEFLVRRSCCA